MDWEYAAILTGLAAHAITESNETTRHQASVQAKKEKDRHQNKTKAIRDTAIAGILVAGGCAAFAWAWERGSATSASISQSGLRVERKDNGSKKIDHVSKKIDHVSKKIDHVSKDENCPSVEEEVEVVSLCDEEEVEVVSLSDEEEVEVVSLW